MYSRRCRATATSLRIQLDLSETYFVVYFQTSTHFYAHNLLVHILLYLRQKYSIYGDLIAISYKCILRDVGIIKRVCLHLSGNIFQLLLSFSSFY